MIPKYRAWDKDRQKWSPYRISSLRHIDDVEIEFFDTVQGVWYTDEDLEDNWILIQSTGLRDKNGVEIYEGDVVNITQYFGGHPYGETKHIIKRSEYNNNLVADSESGDWRTPEVNMTFRSSDDYEVIGNKFEHPHLLEGADE